MVKAGESLGWMEVGSEVGLGMEVEVEVEVEVVVVAVVAVVATVRMAVRKAVWETVRRQPQRVRRAGCVVVADDGGEGSSWDRCGRCMTVQPVPHRAVRRVDGGWTSRCTTVACRCLSSTGCSSTLHSH